MNGIAVLLLAALISLSASAFSGNSTPTGSDEITSNQNGPAPNSGDGIPDGSGNTAPFGPVKGN